MKQVKIFIAIAAFVYVCLRAINVSITYDEAWTLYAFARQPVLDIVTAKNPVANNHILNSLLVKCCLIFSDSEFTIRLPNLFGFALYLYSCHKISELIFRDKTYLQLILFICLVGNPTLLNFFGLCRGYGIGIGLMTYSLLQLMTLDLANRKQVHLCLTSATLATYASFSILYVSTAIIILVAIRQFRYNRKAVVPLIYLSALCILCGYPLFRMAFHNELYFGGDKNFLANTMTTLAADYMGHTLPTAFYDIMAQTLLQMVAISALIILYHVLSPKNNSTSIAYEPLLILAFSVVCINLTFYLFHTKLAMGRTALYLYPLIILVLFSALSLLKDKYKTLQILVIIPLLISITSTLSTANLHSVYEWQRDADSRKVLHDISDRTSDKKVRLYVYADMQYSIKYYADRKYNTVVAPIDLHTYSDIVNIENYDYVYLPKSTLADYDLSSFTPVAYYNDNSCVLYTTMK